MFRFGGHSRDSAAWIQCALGCSWSYEGRVGHYVIPAFRTVQLSHLFWLSVHLLRATCFLRSPWLCLHTPCVKPWHPRSRNSPRVGGHCLSFLTSSSQLKPPSFRSQLPVTTSCRQPTPVPALHRGPLCSLHSAHNCTEVVITRLAGFGILASRVLFKNRVAVFLLV